MDNHTTNTPNHTDFVSVTDDESPVTGWSFIELNCALAAVGILANVISLWVWQAESGFNPTVFLFKYLAAWDTFYLATVIWYEFTDKSRWTIQVHLLYHLGGLCQLLSVHTTLLVAVCRWMAVTFPLHVRSLLSRSRIAAGCAALFVWCSIAQAVELYSTLTLKHDDGFVIYVLKNCVGLIVPLLLLLVLSIHLLWKARQRGDLSTTNQGSQSSLPAAERSTRRLTLAVVCISLTCFLAYPVGVAVQVHHMEAYCDVTCMILSRVAYVLQLLNSGINFVFYCAFASRFRELLVLRAKSCIMLQRSV